MWLGVSPTSWQQLKSLVVIRLELGALLVLTVHGEQMLFDIYLEIDASPSLRMIAAAQAGHVLLAACMYVHIAC